MKAQGSPCIISILPCPNFISQNPEAQGVLVHPAKANTEDRLMADLSTPDALPGIRLPA